MLARCVFIFARSCRRIPRRLQSEIVLLQEDVELDDARGYRALSSFVLQPDPSLALEPSLSSHTFLILTNDRSVSITLESQSAKINQYMLVSVACNAGSLLGCMLPRRGTVCHERDHIFIGTRTCVAPTIGTHRQYAYSLYRLEMILEMRRPGERAGYFRSCEAPDGK